MGRSSREFELYFAQGNEAFLRGDMETAYAQLNQALRMKPWDDPDLMEIHRRLGDLYCQFGPNGHPDMEQAEKHYVEYLRVGKSLRDSATFAATLKQSHPFVRTPEDRVYNEYQSKLAGIYMTQGLSVDKAEKKAANLGKSGCFIATAACGSDLEPEVMALRLFRDTTLRKNLSGRLFIRLYERISPAIADWILPRKNICRMIRWGFIRPVSHLVSCFGKHR